MSDPSYTGANPLTPTDDLPPLPTLYWNDNTNHLYTQSHMRAYALAARAKRDAEVDRLNRTLASIKESHVEAARIASERGEQLAAAEARVKELEHQLEIAEHDSVHQSQLYSEYAEEWTRERDTLQKRVAELEEKLIVMCVAQINAIAAVPDGFSYAASRAMAVTSEWVRGWDACRASIEKQSVPSPNPPAPAPLAAQELK